MAKKSKSASKKATPKTTTTDDVTRAPESGDPKVSGRSHGRIVDESGEPVARGEELDTSDENWESGRHSAD
jgi:hypothetical protein